MSTREQVSFITRFELFNNGLTPLLLVVFSGAFLIIFAADASLTHSMIGDIIFLSLFSGSFTLFARARFFKRLILSQNVMLTYQVFLMQQLPITHEAIARSRLIINNVYNLLMQSCFIIPYFIFVPSFREEMTIPIFIVFCVIWMSVGITASGSSATEDVGKTFHKRDRITLFRLIGSITLSVVLFASIHIFTPYTLIEGTVYLANTWPIPSCVISIGMAYLGIRYGKRTTIQRLQTTDYF